MCTLKYIYIEYTYTYKHAPIHTHTKKQMLILLGTYLATGLYQKLCLHQASAQVEGTFAKSVRSEVLWVPLLDKLARELILHYHPDTATLAMLEEAPLGGS